jgi:polyhydroxyalkanoate synthesis regulator protein
MTSRGRRRRESGGFDSRHGVDRTHGVLVDLVVIREVELPDARVPMFSEAFLCELIRLSETGASRLVTEFLNHSMQTLAQIKADGVRDAESDESDVT